MQITVIAVGKLKERHWREAVDEYVKRLGAYASVRVVEIDDRDHERLGDDRARSAEGSDIARAIEAAPGAGGGGRPYVVALDIQGKARSSEELASLISDLPHRGYSSLVFVIGGSVGLDSAVLSAADERLSFGPMTLPHNLARVVLVEQIYRAYRIARGEPYHK